jgi:hypothetical protein
MLIAMRASLLLFFAMIHPPAQGADSPKPVTLASMRDHARPLLVFAPTDKDQALLVQIRLFASDRSAMHQREVLLVPITQNAEATASGPMSPQEAAAVRRRFHIAPNAFTVLLLGKDGGEKLRSHVPIPPETLIRTIDSMPMRQQEMRERSTEPKTP